MMAVIFAVFRRKKYWRCEGARLLEEARKTADDMTGKEFVIF